MDRERGALYRAASALHGAVRVDLKDVACGHSAPMNPPSIDEKGAVAQRIAEVVVDTLVQIKVRREPQRRSEIDTSFIEGLQSHRVTQRAFCKQAFDKARASAVQAP